MKTEGPHLPDLGEMAGTGEPRSSHKHAQESRFFPAAVIVTRLHGQHELREQLSGLERRFQSLHRRTDKTAGQP